MADRIGMMRPALCAAAVTLASAVGFAQAPNGGGPGPVLGIVEIPKMFAFDPDTGRLEPRGALTLYTRPDSNSREAATITAPQAIDDAEYGYEEPGALVYRREAGHYLIRTARGTAWLAPEDAGPFHSFEMLVSDGLAYLTAAWDGFVSPSPGSAARTRVQRRAEGSDDVVKTTLGIWYQAFDRSLTQEEVGQLHQQLASRVAEVLPIKLITQERT